MTHVTQDASLGADPDGRNDRRDRRRRRGNGRGRRGLLAMALGASVLTLPSTLATAGAAGTAGGGTAGAGDVGSAAQENLLINAGFEQPDPGRPSHGWSWFLSEANVPGWSTTDPAGAIELWYTARPNNAEFAGGQRAYEGDYFVELDANEPSTLYQDMRTRPGDVITWRLAHRARGSRSTDTMQVLVGAGGGKGLSGLTPSVPTMRNGETLSPPRDPSNPTDAHLVDDSSAWGVWSGVYTVPAGQTVTRFAFQAISSTLGRSIGNFLDGIEFEGTPVPPDPTCDVVPFLTAGESATVGSTTVDVRANNARNATGVNIRWENYYWHDATVRGRASTTWTFSPPITGLEIDVRFHDDGRPPEEYHFVGADAAGADVIDWTLVDTNGTYVWRFAQPLTTLRADFSPFDGPYGSLVRLRIPGGEAACGTAEDAPRSAPLTVQAPSVMTPAGSPEPIPPARAFATQTDPAVEVALIDDPTCRVLDDNGDDITTDVDTPPGEYEIRCEGGTAPEGYSIEAYVSGAYEVLPVDEEGLVEPEIEYESETVIHEGEDFVPVTDVEPAICEERVRYWVTPDPTGDGDGRLVIRGEVDTEGWKPGRYDLVAVLDGDDTCAAERVEIEIRVTDRPDTARRPGKPRDVDAVSLNVDGSVTITWDVPRDDGGAPIIAYKVRFRRVTEEKYQPYSRVTDLEGRTETIGGLLPGKRYWFVVRAVNRVGTGPSQRTPLRIKIPDTIPAATQG